MRALGFLAGELGHVEEPNDGFQGDFSAVLANDDTVPLAAVPVPHEETNLTGIAAFPERCHGEIPTPYVGGNIGLQPAIKQHFVGAEKQLLVVAKTPEAVPFLIECPALALVFRDQPLGMSDDFGGLVFKRDFA